jgi:N-acetylglucosaminyldiphosphoundecaprenol N-acetyl-beta-D-mannosaminyltransferase
MMQVNVLGVRIDAVTMEEAVAAAENCIAGRRPGLIATANAEMVIAAQQDGELARILAAADLVVPDGAGVVWAARYHGQTIPERVAGYDLTQALLAKAAVKGYRVFFFGGAPGIAEKARDAAEIRYPGLKVAGVRHGFFSAQDERQIIADIRAATPDILLVALGVPRQEKWLSAHFDEVAVPVCMGVGGTFDVMAGVVQRAPLWMQRANLEWLFRLLSQPSRFMRMLALPRFVLRVMTAKKH